MKGVEGGGGGGGGEGGENECRALTPPSFEIFLPFLNTLISYLGKLRPRNIFCTRYQVPFYLRGIKPILKC